MKFCNNCGSKINDQVKFCVECGTKIRTGLGNNDKLVDFNEKSESLTNIFMHNGISIDLEQLSIKHGMNKISAIKELRQLTGLNLSDAKTVIDGSYSGNKYIKNDTAVIRSNNKGCLRILLWLVFFPIMAINGILKNETIIKPIKAIFIILIIIISIPILTSYIQVLKNEPQVLFILVIVLLIYLFKKKRDSLNLQERNNKKEDLRIECERQDSITTKTLNIIFANDEMNRRLKEFILQHTRKYDFGEIDYNNYLNTLDMFLIYINRKINTEYNITLNNDTKDIIEYWGKDKPIIIDREMVKRYIDNKKLEVYSEDIKNIINLDEYETINDVVKEYVYIYGDKGLYETNLKILSNSLDEDYNEITSIVKNEYSRVKEEYEMRRMESHLFKSETKNKDLEYIDSLSGFEFEDFLKGLFIEFGYMSKDLPYSNDYGADLIINKGFHEIVIQAKNYSGNVGNKAVQEVIAAKVYYKCDIGMVLTNSYYTQNAIKTAKASDIILVDRDGLEKILNEGSMYFNKLVS